MQRIDIPKIIAFLIAQPSVSALVGNRVYWGIPKTEQTENFVAIQEVTDNRDEVEAVARLEFRFIAKDDEQKWADLYAIERAITPLIAERGTVDFGGFKAHKITLESNVFQGFDEKTRKIYIRDYLFSYLS